MIPRVQNAIDVKKAIEGADRKLTKIGFDASVLEDGYHEIKSTIELYADRDLSPDPDESTLTVPGGGKVDKTQMVCHRRVVEF
jgi:hypothetical protein